MKHWTHHQKTGDGNTPARAALERRSGVPVIVRR